MAVGAGLVAVQADVQLQRGCWVPPQRPHLLFLHAIAWLISRHITSVSMMPVTMLCASSLTRSTYPCDYVRLAMEAGHHDLQHKIPEQASSIHDAK